VDGADDDNGDLVGVDRVTATCGSETALGADADDADVRVGVDIDIDVVVDGASLKMIFPALIPVAAAAGGYDNGDDTDDNEVDVDGDVVDGVSLLSPSN
jgi:hypothetical protein